MRLQKLSDTTSADTLPGANTNNKKRKASDDEEDTQSPEKKRSKADLSLADTSFAPSSEEYSTVPTLHAGISIPSRPATPMKPLMETPAQPPEPNVDEDEWAAFEADIAAAETAPDMNVDAVISAPAMTAKELEARSLEDANSRRKERAEAELEGDKEDATRKLEEEFEEMDGLEERVRKLREKREALRIKDAGKSVGTTPPQPEIIQEYAMEDDDEEDDDDWDGFRLKG